MIKQIAIIGLGMMGGSLAMACRENQLCEKIIGYDLDLGAHKVALDKRWIDNHKNDLAEVAQDADIIIIAAPMSQYQHLFSIIDRAAKHVAIITDIGSCKLSAKVDAQKYLPNHFANFIPGHPIAGSEKSGIRAAIKNLFMDRSVILTPTEQANKEALTTVKALWENLGAKVINMSAEEHDKLLAATSHLPQILSYAFMEFINSYGDSEQLKKVTGSGFRDFTRLAGSDPSMWRDICLQNKTAILSAISQFQKILSQFEKLLKNENMAELVIFMEKAQALKNSIDLLRNLD